MAKKNIANLVSGIMGNPINEVENSSDKQQDLPGPAKKSKKDEGDEIMTTSFRAPKKIMRKLRMISGAEGVGVGTIIQEAFENYINKWESEHGSLNF